ncbi:MAG: hypothetical protein IKH27_06555 [Oscillospiraceae bacterium]|nr:hypothetical protein [Oscillospiraceae bacterium]
MAMSNSYARRRRRSKAGSTAIPFMITILISLLVFGGVALYFYNKLTEKTNELKVMEPATKIISAEDINTILFVLDPADEGRKNAVMLMRFDPVRKQILCIGIPLELQVQLDSRVMTVGACYENHGAVSLKDAVAETIGQPVDRYIMMDSRGFATLVNIFGNPKTTIDIEDTGLNKSKNGLPETLDIGKYELLLTSQRYADEIERCTKIGLSIAQLINDCISPEDSHATAETSGGSRIANNLDKYFNTVFNAITTDITVIDYEDHKHAISYVFQYAVSPARGYTMGCQKQEDGTLTINESTLNDLKMLFASSSSNTKSSGDSSSESQAEAPAEAPAEEPAEAPAEEQPADPAE